MFAVITYLINTSDVSKLSDRIWQSTINCFDRDEAVAIKLSLEGQYFVANGKRYCRECEIVYHVRDVKGRLFQVNPEHLFGQLKHDLEYDRQDRETSNRKDVC